MSYFNALSTYLLAATYSVLTPSTLSSLGLKMAEANLVPFNAPQTPSFALCPLDQTPLDLDQ